MFGTKVRIRKALHDKLKSASEILGCASVDEFVERTLEAEADKIISQTESSTTEMSKEEIDDISKKLQGLGYLD